MTTITQNEAKVLRSLLTNDFTASNGGIPTEYPGASNMSVWSECINDSVESSGIEGRALSGVVSSLVAKGLAFSDSECCGLTEAGFTAALEARS